MTREFGIESLSSAQVGRATRLLDDELEAWRNRPLGEIKYLILDARYEKMRHGGAVRDAAVLSAIGVALDERRRVLEVSLASRRQRFTGTTSLKVSLPMVCAGSSLSSRTIMAGCALRAVPSSEGALGSAASSTSPRMPSTMPPTQRSARASGARCALCGTQALSPSFRAPWLATRLEQNAPEGLAVFTLPEHNRRRLRTSNPMERAVQQELKRRTVKLRVFPNEDALLRLVTAILFEIDENLASDNKGNIKWECQKA